MPAGFFGRSGCHRLLFYTCVGRLLVLRIKRARMREENTRARVGNEKPLYGVHTGDLGGGGGFI